MTLYQIVILAIIQGLAELLPVSSTAHVIVAEKLMGVDPSTPQATMLLVMLHTGTMFAVIVYFWRAWQRAFFSSRQRTIHFLSRVFIATLITGVIGICLKVGIEKYLKRAHGSADAEVEQLFRNLPLMSASLAAAGLLILVSGFRRTNGRDRINTGDSIWIGAVQGLCLPFRGFSRSGATISVGLLRDIARARAEEFSFALAVVLTPAIVFLEARRLVHHPAGDGGGLDFHAFAPSLLGMLFSFLAGLLALKVLSRLLEKGQWGVFGLYCLAAAGAVYALYLQGY